MNQKLAIVLLVLALLVTLVGIVVFVRGQRSVEPTPAPVTTNVIDQAPTAEPTPAPAPAKRVPTEEEIQVEMVKMNQELAQPKTGNLSTEELKFIANPRGAVIEKLSK